MTATPLSEAFVRRLPSAVAGGWVESLALEAQLAEAISTARASWPTLDVDPELFVEHLARHAPSAGALQALNLGDLYLAFACLLGDSAALEAFEAKVLARVPSALRSTSSGLSDDDVLQALRLKLFVRHGETSPRIEGYSGRGSLVSWLRAAAVRLSLDHARSNKIANNATDGLADTPVSGADLDLAYLKQRYAPEFKAAFQQALSQLSARDQNLLRLQYLDGMSPDEIGRIYQTHRTTVWRWLTACRAKLLQLTREALAARVKVDQAELSSLMNVVHSQLDVSISRVLRKQ